ncbi:hypothetical protein THRCLA_10692, partial [Thraustotheca clavata]
MENYWFLDEQAQSLGYNYFKSDQRVLVRVNVPCKYLGPLVLKAFSNHPKFWDVITLEDDPRVPQLLWDEYENLDWKNILSGQVIANSYCVRKGLSRKAQLSMFLSKYIRKHPNCALSKAVPPTIVVDLWDAFDSSLAELGISFRNRLESCLWEVKLLFEDKSKQAKYIMKPSASNKGAEVNVFDTYEKFKGIISEWTDIREWVVQSYVERPLLLKKRKFHVRVYVVAVSSLQVYVYQNVLLLTSLDPYNPSDTDNKLSHITNTFQQQDHPNFVEADCVLLLEDMESILSNDRNIPLSEAKSIISKMMKDIGVITGEVFDAYKGEFSVFQPLPNCFEVYGVDFLIDEDFQVWLLEVNPGPDFKQTGKRLQPVIQTLVNGMVSIVTDTFFSKPAASYPSFERMNDGILHSMAEADSALVRMNECLETVLKECLIEGTGTESDFVAKTKNAMDTATELSKQLAACLEAEKHKRGHDKVKLKLLQKGFINSMKQLQEAQRIYARRHEAVIEYDLIKTACISTDDLKKAKEERDMALEIAEDAVQVNKAVVAVGKLVQEQTATITQIK